MYRSTQAPFDAHCRHDDVATALIRGICKMQLAVRIDKRPGESHMALDGKKKHVVHFQTKLQLEDLFLMFDVCRVFAICQESQFCI